MQNIRVIFTDKAISASDEIINKYKLNSDAYDLIRNFAENKISENELGNALKIADAPQAIKEISEKILPLLEKIPEEKLQDIDFVNNSAKNFWTNQQPAQQPQTMRPDIIETKPSPRPVQKKMPADVELPQQQKQQSGSDKYRESIN